MRRGLKKALILSKKCPLATLVSAVLTPENVAAVAVPHVTAQLAWDGVLVVADGLIAEVQRMPDLSHAARTRAELRGPPPEESADPE
jgi:hypothetical protein